MSENKKAYRFTGPGKFLAFTDGAHRPLEVGEIFYMTDTAASAVQDRFKPAPGESSHSAAEVPAKTPESPAEVPNGEKAQETPPPAASGPTLGERLAIADAVVAGNIEHSAARIRRIKSLEDLAAVEVAENGKAKPRFGVLRAISARRTELNS